MSVNTSKLCFYYIQMPTFCFKMLDQMVGYLQCVNSDYKKLKISVYHIYMALFQFAGMGQ